MHSTARTGRCAALAAALLLIDGVLLTGPAQATAEPPIVGPLTCRYWGNSWSGGFSADLMVRNGGPAITGWTVAWTVPVPTTNQAVWSATQVPTTPMASAFSNVAWNATIPAGGAVTFGWTARAAATEVPGDITVNGVPCPVTG